MLCTQMFEHKHVATSIPALLERRCLSVTDRLTKNLLVCFKFSVLGTIRLSCFASYVWNIKRLQSSRNIIHRNQLYSGQQIVTLSLVPPFPLLI